MQKQYKSVDEYCADRYAAQTALLEFKDKQIQDLTNENELLKEAISAFGSPPNLINNVLPNKVRDDERSVATDAKSPKKKLSAKK